MAKTEVKRNYYPKGKLRGESHWVNGKCHGIAKWWHDNGQLWEEIPYANGQVHGLALWWYHDGMLDELNIWNKARHGFRLKYSNYLDLRTIPQFTREQWRKLK